MTVHELRICFGVVYQCLRNERRMREQVFAGKPILRRKLREIDDAMRALVAMKDELKRHVEESPEQVSLFEDQQAPKGY